MRNPRKDHELPVAVAKWGWKYHHLGIPTKVKMPGEKYLQQFRFYVSGFDKSPFGIEWMRFAEECPQPELIREIPHLAFEVNDIDLEIRKHNLKVISGPASNTDGIKVAMIEHDGAPVELIEFTINKKKNH
jgi:hypothetical protein